MEVELAPLTSRLARIYEGGLLQIPWTPLAASLTELSNMSNPQAAEGRGIYFTLNTKSKEGRQLFQLIGIKCGARTAPQAPILKYITERRNAATKVAMQRAAALEEDPNAEKHDIADSAVDGGSAALRNRRKALLDDIPKEMIIDIPAFGVTPSHMIRVLPTCWPGSRRRFRC